MLSALEVKEFVINNPKLVSCRASTRYPEYMVLKYKPEVFYSNLWNPILEDLRGVVVDNDFNPVILPFRKIYNNHENNVTIDRDHNVVAVRKVNGFMSAATYIESMDKVVVSTTGSLDSSYVDIGESMLTNSIRQYIKQQHFNRLTRKANTTWIFECVSQEDSIVHPIKEKEGLYLLGVRRCVWGQDQQNTKYHSHQSYLDEAAHLMGVERPEWVVTRFSDIVKFVKSVKYEGFVVYDQEAPYTKLKLKSPYYLVTKFLSRMSDLKLGDYLDRPDILKQKLDEEFYPLIDNLCANKEDFVKLPTEGKIAYIKEVLNE